MNIKDHMENNTEITDLLDSIPDDELNSIIIENYKTGEILIKKGTMPEKVFILLSGLVDVVIDTREGTTFNSYKIIPVDIFGVSEIISKELEPYIATIIAHVDCVVGILDKDTFLSWLNTYNRFCFVAMSMINTRLHNAINQYVDLTNKSTHYKTLYYLVNCYDYYVQAYSTKSNKIKFLETRAEMADKIGANIRSVNRSLQQFKKQGLINVTKGKIEIDDSQINKLREELVLNLL